MPKITISISLDLDNNKIKTFTHKKNINLKDIISLLTKEETNPQYKNITLGDLIKKYAYEKNLKPSSIRHYQSGLSTLFGVNYKNFKISDICSEATVSKFLTKQISYKSFDTLTIILNYAKKKIILNNPYDINLFNIKKRKITKHREALKCENWLSLNEAEYNIALFLNKLNLAEANKLNSIIIYTSLLTMILATRINETFQVINNYNKTNDQEHYIYIDNKNTKKGAILSYRLALTVPAIYLINKLHSLGVKSYSSLYLIEASRQKFITISNLLQNKITLHGLRSIFRTTIEFLPTTQNIPHWIKEYSLSHETRNIVERSYQRNDALKSRYFLQVEYSKFIFNILKNKELLELANKDLWWKE